VDRAGTSAVLTHGMNMSAKALLLELVDEQAYPRLHRIAWSAETSPQSAASEHDEFFFGLDRIVDGVQAYFGLLSWTAMRRRTRLPRNR
jgi:hypothetical protein